jgi:ankyrin repeat protein
MDLFEAIAAGDADTALALLAADPAVGRHRHSSGATPVLYALYHRQGGLARTLADRVAALDLAEAAALDDVDRLTGLLDAGGAVDGRTPDGFTPLHLAAYFGAPRVAALLLARGADVAAVADNPMRIQALHAAAAGRHLAIATALLAAGADPDARQQAGYTPLMAAAANGDAELTRALLAAGADPALTNDSGASAADIAREHGQDLPAGLAATPRQGR